ncbi:MULTISPECIES: DUF1672 family protein [Listeria]|uniref:DUF1672 family protein n=1 Tax=Listeria TaxID=1637 RepID=UPI000B58D514|nr:MULTISPECIES: DUF1672 family protein [Listeria]
MKGVLLGLLIALVTLSGCSETNEKKEAEGTTPVQDYIGQGFIFVDGDKSKDIVEKNEAEISRRAIKYMKETYKTDVKVNNVVPARSAAVVMVEAEEPIQFHTSVIVGLDMAKKTLDPEEANVVRSEEGEVEKAIVSGLYAKAYEEEFANLDKFLAELAKENDVLGLRQEAVDKTASDGYQTKYFFISVFANDYKEIYNDYLKGDIDQSKLKTLFSNRSSELDQPLISIDFYSKMDKLPEKEVANRMIKKLNEQANIPKGEYSIDIFKNSIVNRVGLPDGESVSAESLIIY